ncbi:MAG: lipopolysaccharide A protein [Bacteroidetes bacterium]|jgi:hypothetical protein|nr:lipopolysaccharide A protein [Bacteroidota bacterium]
MNFWYYLKNYSYNALPKAYFRWKYSHLKRYEKSLDSQKIQNRLNYYFKIQTPFPIPDEAISIKNYKKTKGTGYYLDLKEFLHYFSKDTKFTFVFGDSTKIHPYPSLIKARPIEGNNRNSILFKLNKRRHFRWVKDRRTFEEKKDLLVWRGSVYQPLRKRFVQKYWNHPRCNVGQTNRPKENVPWQKPFMSVSSQLKYKFVFCPEGNDVATNLKWAMSSNSLCLMPKPRFETWFMEGTLKPNIHYAVVKDDFSDLEEKMDFFLQHPERALQIIKNAQSHVRKFQNKRFEELLCLKVLEKYAALTGQI